AVCGGSCHDYEIAANSAATTLTWGAPAGCIISDKKGHTGNPLTVTGTDPNGEYEVSVTFPSGFVSGNITVYATNACGNSPTTSLFVQSKPNAPGAISGPTVNLCNKTGQTFSIAAVPGATSYTWTKPSGATITNNYGTSIKVNFGSSFTGSGNITVKANNACGASPVTSLTVFAAPAQPGNISGSNSVCKSNTAVPYSISPVTGATSYTWTITGGATFVGSTSGTSVTVKYTTASSTSATLSVKANNACNSSPIRTLAITVSFSCRTIDEETAEETSYIPEFSSEMIAYPNPTSDKLNVAFKAAGSEHYTLRITDLVGNMIIKEINSATVGDNLREFDLSHLSQGMYFVTLEMEGAETKTIRVAVK
ncbi:MAG TPA: T9SS type A sorting domain-containing protein, partial [Bacteroidia bacterium]|nr:T9SS type A sorting domain-containing protein [Bacteroidia bacterium]